MARDTIWCYGQARVNLVAAIASMMIIEEQFYLYINNIRSQRCSASCRLSARNLIYYFTWYCRQAQATLVGAIISNKTLNRDTAGKPHYL